jgi:predicted class III extradiol MEMO1 family dioxygenase
VTITLKKPDLLPRQTKDLVAANRLKGTHQGLGVKAVRHDHQFVHPSMESVYSEHTRGAQYSQPVKALLPEIVVFSQGHKRFQKRLDLMDGIFLV